MHPEHTKERFILNLGQRIKYLLADSLERDPIPKSDRSWAMASSMLFLSIAAGICSRYFARSSFAPLLFATSILAIARFL